MNKNQAGFSIVAAMGLSGMLMISVLAIMSMQKSINEDTKHTAVRHARYLAEDILKTQVAIKAQKAASRAEIVTFVNGISGALKIPIPGTNCGSNLPCNLVVLSSSPSPIPTPNNPNTTIVVDVEIGISAAQSEFLKFKIQPLIVKLAITSSNDIRDRSRQSLGSYSCGAESPIFKGIKKVNNSIVADCAPISAPNANVSYSRQTKLLSVLCSVSEGKWMKSVSSQLNPECVDFSTEPQGVPEFVEVCTQTDQYPKSYSLDSKFIVTSKACNNKGNPYEYAPISN